MISPSGIFKFYFVYWLCPFLSLPCLNFNQLFLLDQGLSFGYVSPHNILNVHKNFHKIWTSITTLNMYCFIIIYYIDFKISKIRLNSYKISIHVNILKLCMKVTFLPNIYTCEHPETLHEICSYNLILTLHPLNL
jgi:hypothetical protein